MEKEDQDYQYYQSENMNISLFSQGGLIMIMIVVIIYCLLYSSLSNVDTHNEYMMGLEDMAMMRDECMDDQDCINGTCYIGKCECYDGLSGEDCQIPCYEWFNKNCTINVYEQINCTCNETIFTIIDVNCTINEVIVDTNCTINEIIVDTNCTVNEIIVDVNCTINEVIVDVNCTVNEILLYPNCSINKTATPINNPNCTCDSDCAHGVVQSGNCFFGKCVCIPGYAGSNCDYLRVDSSSCTGATCNTGICILLPPLYTAGECFCPSGVSGPTCSLID